MRIITVIYVFDTFSKTPVGKTEDKTCIMSEIPQYKNPSGKKSEV